LSKHKVFWPKVSHWRQHHTGYGKPKAVYLTVEDAAAAVEAHAQDGITLSAYRCGQCLDYHIGRSRKMAPLSTAEFLSIQHELGIRVAANFKEEVLHPYGTIRKRWLTGVKYALRKKAA
jgi:hypothetical protein